MLDWPISIAVNFGAQLVLWAVGGLALLAAPAEPPAEPLTVHEVRTATDEEITAAALEVPELLRRAEEAARMERDR